MKGSEMSDTSEGSEDAPTPANVMQALIGLLEASLQLYCPQIKCFPSSVCAKHFAPSERAR